MSIEYVGRETVGSFSGGEEIIEDVGGINSNLSRTSIGEQQRLIKVLNIP